MNFLNLFENTKFQNGKLHYTGSFAYISTPIYFFLFNILLINAFAFHDHVLVILYACVSTRRQKATWLRIHIINSNKLALTINLSKKATIHILMTFSNR